MNFSFGRYFDDLVVLHFRWVCALRGHFWYHSGHTWFCNTCGGYSPSEMWNAGKQHTLPDPSPWDKPEYYN